MQPRSQGLPPEERKREAGSKTESDVEFPTNYQRNSFAFQSFSGLLSCHLGSKVVCVVISVHFCIDY